MGRVGIPASLARGAALCSCLAKRARTASLVAEAAVVRSVIGLEASASACNRPPRRRVAFPTQPPFAKWTERAGTLGVRFATFSTSSGKKFTRFKEASGLMPNGLIGVFGVLGVFGVRKAFGEDACDTILSKLWEAFAKKRMEIAMAT